MKTYTRMGSLKAIWRSGFALLCIALLSGFGCSGNNNVEPSTRPDSTDQSDNLIKSGTTLKVMTYNIRHGNPPAADVTVLDLGGIAAVINKENPDIVALQEVDKNTRRSGVTLDQARDLANRTKMHVFFSKSIDYQGGEYGIAVLSRYPIIEQQRYELPIASGVSAEKRTVALIAVATDKAGEKLWFGSTHLEYRDVPSKQLQVAEIIRVNEELKAPLVLGGDFNAALEDPVLQSLQSAFRSACTDNCPNTYPAVNPDRAIDHIFINRAADPIFTIISYRTAADTLTSDHRAVVCELKLR